MRKNLLTFAALCAFAAHASAATQFVRTNLVSNVSGLGVITDPNLKNAWGISQSASSPFWVSDNGTGVATLYNVDPVTQAPAKVGLTVTIPGDGSVTGQAFNPASAGGAFNGDNFLFVNEDGTISGWRGALGTNAEVLQLSSASTVYKGTTFEANSSNTYLLSANFRSGKIDVLKGATAAPDLTGNFTDPALPAGYAPFNVRLLGSTVYVAYAKQGTLPDEADGAGLGFVSAFDTQGAFLGRIASAGTLNAPWGLAIAPSSFGDFAGDLLVGNFGDGRINAYNLATDAFAGQLQGTDGNPLAIDGLWGLTVGNGTQGSTNAIYFSAGPNDEADGLFGVLSVPEPASLSLLPLALAALAARRRRL